MAVLVETQGQRLALVKAAPEVVVQMCSTVADSTATCQPLGTDNVLQTAQLFGRSALRTLGFAIKELPAGQVDLRHEDCRDMCFVGLQGMIDPPKQSAIEAVAQCKGAGIRSVMITGDHPDTAQAVARQLGIAAERVITGAELSHMSEAQLHDAVAQVSVFARVAPEHKKVIAEAL